MQRGAAPKQRAQYRGLHASGPDPKLELSEMLRRVQQFAGEHATCLVQVPQKGVSPSGSRRGAHCAAVPSDQERALAAQSLLKATSSETWAAAVKTTKVVEVLCKMAEHHLEACVFSERPKDYKHGKVLALSIMLLEHGLTSLGSVDAALVAQQPLKRLLQVLVAPSDDVIKGPARALLRALSATEAGASRLLKDGVVHILAELIRADGSWSSDKSDAHFSAASLEYMIIVQNLASASTASVHWEICGDSTGQEDSSSPGAGAAGERQNGEKISRQFSPVLLECLGRFLARNDDKAACGVACAVLLQFVSRCAEFGGVRVPKEG
jgi:hypothetical protein